MVVPRVQADYLKRNSSFSPPPSSTAPLRSSRQCFFCDRGRLRRADKRRREKVRNAPRLAEEKTCLRNRSQQHWACEAPAGQPAIETVQRWIEKGKLREQETRESFRNQEVAASGIRLKKVGAFGGHYSGSHQGVHFEVWKSVHHTNTSRAASRVDQRVGHQSCASSRKDVVWNWRAKGGSTHDGFGTQKSALAHIVSMAERKQGPWRPGYN